MDIRIRTQPADAGLHILPGIAHCGGIADIECHTLYIRFVRDVGCIDFECDRIAQLIRHQHGLGGRARQDGFGDWNMKCRQQSLGFHFRQNFTTFGQHTFNQDARAFYVWLSQL